jgi:hypothetical protein
MEPFLYIGPESIAVNRKKVLGSALRTADRFNIFD